MMYGWWDGSSAPWHGMILGPIMMITFIILTVLIVALVLRMVGLGWQSSSRENLALDILNERFARGEIDRAEYTEKRQHVS